jgi:ribosomal-protein-serine acetyltransferase
VTELEVDWPLGDHTSLRSFVPGDAEELFALVEANRDRLLPWMPWSHATQGPADVLGFIERSRSTPGSRFDATGIWVDERIAGTTGLRLDPSDIKGEIGYWIGREFEGQGLVTRACERFLEHGFDELGLHRISIHAAVENARSRAVAERLGFVREGIERGAERCGDVFHDLVVYSMLEDEWRERARA